MKQIKRLFTVAILLGFVSTASAAEFNRADKTLWEPIKESFFADRPVTPVDFIIVDAPKRAESGAQVPVTYRIDSKAANGVVIKKLYSFVDGNPIPLTATFHLTPALGKDFKLSTRIRFEKDAYIRLVGEDEKGNLYLGSKVVRAAGGCGGIVANDEAKVRAQAGKIKMKMADTKIGKLSTAVFNVRHVMRTGLQRDLVSQGFLPPFYIKKTDFTYNGKPVMTVDVNVGTAENPYFKFDFIPDGPGSLKAVATDNEDKVFNKSIDVKG